ncbi:uncharacterized protein [Rutidosis leptorrhynchoides]|uniref:uncharacterized protein n=1 Tax=Rutidosis leptorrhynchoides TaxID=125765 RepID=UPI003A995FF5
MVSKLFIKKKKLSTNDYRQERNISSLGAKLDRLPTRLNISYRGIEIKAIGCPRFRLLMFGARFGFGWIVACLRKRSGLIGRFGSLHGMIDYYKGASVGHRNVDLTHLQYTNDALFFGEWSRTDIENLIDLVTCFGEVSGLKINFVKSIFYGVNVAQEDVTTMAHMFHCSAGSFPFEYLGIPIGLHMNKSVLGRARLLSVGGRLTLTKSVLGSLPLYFLSLFKASSGVVKLLESIRRKFMWNARNNNSITWVKWNQALDSKKLGGLGIGSIQAKNLSLLAKWWWRLKTERNFLWANTIKSIYGEDGGFA